MCWVRCKKPKEQKTQTRAEDNDNHLRIDKCLGKEKQMLKYKQHV